MGSGWQSGMSDEVVLRRHDTGEPCGLQRVSLFHGALPNLRERFA